MSAICDAHKKKVEVDLLYYSVHRKFNQLEIRCCRENSTQRRWALRTPNWAIRVQSLSQLELRCSRENQHPAEGALRTPDWAVEVQISWREDSGMRNMSQRGWAPRPPVEQPRRTGKKHCYGHKSEGQYVAVLFGLQLPLTHNPFNKVRGRFF